MKTSVAPKMARFHSEAGIAIGPILFVVAILGILAAAIAAGSGSFTTSTSGEASRTKASALIEIGQNLKIGMDRITGLGTDVASVVIDPAQTGNSDDLFSPTGGGINPPSTTMANDPPNDAWFYVDGAVPQLGTSGTEKLAMIEVASAVCDQINLKAVGLSATPSGADIGNVISNTLGTDVSNWPTALKGKPTACVYNTDAASGGYWFYQVLNLQ
ncbi:MAG: hypothetical protein GC131_08065 [Alphaproteobacteria bacterium]|nr:hypothetical protein [Alphaproteobacteria bacterium]